MCFVPEEKYDHFLWMTETLITSGLARYALCYKSGINLVGLSRNILIVFKSHSPKQNPYLAPLLDQKPVASQATVVPLGKPTINILLHEYIIKIILNDLSLCP